MEPGESKEGICKQFDSAPDNYRQHEIVIRASSENLRDLLNHVNHRHPLRSLIANELQLRLAKQAATPHWTMKWGFVVAVIAAVAAIVAALPEVRSWFKNEPYADKVDVLPAPARATPSTPSSKSPASLPPKTVKEK